MKLHLARKAPLKVGVVALVILTLAVGVALALTMSNADGKWSNVVASGGSGYTVGCLYYGNPTNWSTNVNTYQDSNITDENQARWGGIDNTGDCTPHPSQSGFGFDGTDGPLEFAAGETFLLGKFTHFNNPVMFTSANYTPASMNLAITLSFSDPPALNPVLNYSVLFHETQNDLNPCPYGDSTGAGCDDRVTLPAAIPDQTFDIGGVQYTLQIIGFVPDADGVCPATPAGSTSSVYTTGEGQNNYACLYGQIVLPIDSGDAPDLDLGQTSGANRGRHTITATGSYLGTVRGDGENDGQPNATATGDDLSGLDDEDGFVSMDTNWGDGQGHVVVSVTRGQFTGINRACVYGWIDWGNDGFGVNADSFATGHRTDPGNGEITLTFDTNVPGTGSFPASTYLRLRVVSSTTSSCPTLGPTGPATDGEIEDHRLSFSPLAVELAGFTASAAPEGVALAWETVSEVDVAGFNLYRGETATGPWAQVNETLIAALAPGAATGGSYAFTDTAAPQGAPVWYQLEDVALDGATMRHDPVSVTLDGEPNAVSLSAFGATAPAAWPAVAGLAAALGLAAAGFARRRK